MPYRLELNQGGATGHYIKLPSMSFDKVIIDASYQHDHATQKSYFDFRVGFSFGYLNRTTGGVDVEGNDSPMSTYVDGVGPKSNNTVMVPTDTRCLLETRWSAAGTDDGNLFTNSSASAGTFMPVKAYDIKFYSGATLVAHYDLTLGNVQDQSGNGRHATLFGGTFVSEGPTVHEVEGAGTSVSSASSSVVKVVAVGGSAAATSSATGSVGLTANVGGSATAQSSATASVTHLMSVGGSASAVSSASGDVGGSGQVHEVGGSASAVSSTSGSVVKVSSVGGTAAATSGASSNVVKMMFVEGMAAAISSAMSSVIRIALVGGAAVSVSSASFIDGEPIIRKIRLRSERVLIVRLQSSRRTSVRLRGDLMTATNQNFVTYAGDSLDIESVLPDVDMTGAKIKWAMMKSVGDPHVIYKETPAITIDNESGIYVIPLESADTLDLKGAYYHEAELTDSFGKPSTIMTGTITIKPSGV
ncbi:hypothetical protein KP806_07650 [Paenibacillus sp. N4]|uniref:hypothetical protein n=1 Tax=Paenibacillus vietnamensis TaxID=2590547 RepID=UPI001CD1611F|nr:hypothetical protein [Paenibacillus vietnamensis]MCA0754921.1 hypothetical protein [Paenibacillus vietnamensis]